MDARMSTMRNQSISPALAVDVLSKWSERPALRVHYGNVDRYLRARLRGEPEPSNIVPMHREAAHG